jgi:parallel beta-helix repeat protein
MLSTSHALGALRRRVRSAVRAVAPSAALLTLLGSAAHAQTFYVDGQSGTCSSTGAGTELQPYCTIAAAMAAHNGPGVTIIVKPGIYREQITVPTSGAAGSPFVFQASGPGVVIDGSDDFSNTALWVAVGGGTYQAATATWSVKQVFVDGVRLTASTSTPATMPANTLQWVSGAGLYVNLGGANPGTHKTLVGHRNYGFNVYRTFVNISGFEIIRTVDRGINMQNGCADLVISNNKVSFAGSYGIQTVNGQRITITGNTVSDNAFHGIGLTAGASACVVTNNECFRNAHPTIRQANGIYLFGAPRNTISGNRLHDNQDTGLQFNNSSDSCVSSNNRSYNNGDHGYDHLLSIGVMHVNDMAYHNYLDGFSFEGTAPNGQVHNCIATENGEYDLWVDPASSVGFVSDYNLFWNSTAGTAPSGVPQMPVKFVATAYSTLAAYKTATGQDPHSKSADPKFTNAATADFRLLGGSPAIDAAMSSAAGWPATDANGGARMDDPRTANTGVGPVTYADLGALEFVPSVVDHAPVVTAPGTVKGAPRLPITFTITAVDSDGDAITSLTMVAVKMPPLSGATFTPNATNTGGTFSWPSPSLTGNWQVKFVATNKLTGSSTTTIQIKGKGLTAGDESVGGPVLAMSEGAPNPSSRGVSFALDLPEASDVDVSVYDMQGRRVFQESQSLPAGRSSVSWSGLDVNRQRTGTGLYFVRAKVGDVVMVRRVVRF